MSLVKTLTPRRLHGINNRNKLTSVRWFTLLALHEYLFLPEKERLDKLLLDLVRVHAATGAAPAIRHAGRVYIPSGVSRIDRTNIRPPSLALKEQIEKYVDMQNEYERAWNELRNGVSLVIPEECTYQDIRDALPDFCRDAIPEIQTLSRTRPEAFAILKNQKKMQEWQISKEILERYMVYRMAY